ncbi:MAG TPA: triose-phosphate isomerase [Patescibacteria group bacterium]
MIFVNFKTYKEGSGEKALSLVKAIEEISSQNNVKVIPCVQAIDLKTISTSSKLEVWIQNIDPVEYGAHTGSILPEEVLEAGAEGTLLNHSEHKVQNFEDLKMMVARANELGLKTLIFASNLDELSKVCDLAPTFASYEPGELIGSTTTSVATAQPDIIAKAVEITRAKGIPLIVGAGIHSSEDVRKSRELGAVGVAVATDIVKAQDPKKELLDLIEGFK